MDDDLNTADAISVIFELVTEINTNIINQNNISKKYFLSAQQIFSELTGILGILYDNPDNQIKIDPEIKDLAEQRQKARQEKNFALADKIRDEIVSRGFILEDTPSGVVIKKNK